MPGMLQGVVAREGEEASVKLTGGLRRAALFVIAPLGLILASCADKPGGPIPYNVSNFGTPDVPQLVPLEAGYRIEYEVDLAGNISMPLIGEIRAYDLSTAQLDDALTRKLGEKYLENPDVSVGIKASTRRSVTVDGAVARSGSYAVHGPTTLMQAVAAAGGA